MVLVAWTGSGHVEKKEVVYIPGHPSKKGSRYVLYFSMKCSIQALLYLLRTQMFAAFHMRVSV